MPNQPVEEIFHALQRGDNPGMEKVHAFYNQRLEYFIRKFVADIHAAEDIVSEAIVSLWKNRSNIADPRGMNAFVYTIARNRSVDWLRMQQRSAETTRKLRYLTDEAETDQRERMQIETEVLALIHEEIGKLKGRAAEVFRLSFLEGLTTKEIAERLDMSQQNVLNNKNNARDRLRTRLLKKGLLFLKIIFMKI